MPAAGDPEIADSPAACFLEHNGSRVWTLTKSAMAVAADTGTSGWPGIRKFRIARSG